MKIRTMVRELGDRLVGQALTVSVYLRSLRGTGGGSRPKGETWDESRTYLVELDSKAIRKEEF